MKELLAIVITATVVACTPVYAAGVDDQERIPHANQIQIYTPKDNCAITTDVWKLASAFRSMLAGYMTPWAFKKVIIRYYTDNPNKDVPMDNIVKITDNLIKACYGNNL